MSEEERLAQYRICKVRGHKASGAMAMSNPPWHICKYCGTYYRYTEPELVETNIPGSHINVKKSDDDTHEFPTVTV